MQKLLQISNSSSVVAMGFDEPRGVIIIQYHPFKKKEPVPDEKPQEEFYEYSNCTQDEFDTIFLAESIGKMAKIVLKDKQFKKVLE